MTSNIVTFFKTDCICGFQVNLGSRMTPKYLVSDFKGICTPPKKKANFPNDIFLAEEKERFMKTCDVLIERLGERPLHPKGALNASLFDSVFIAFAKNLNSLPDNIGERFEMLKANEEFQIKIGGATTDPEVVQTRLRLAEEILFG